MTVLQRKMLDHDSDSDYNVEDFIQPKRVRKPINDESADLLGNFDDAVRAQIQNDGGVPVHSGDLSDGQSTDSESETDDTSDSDHNEGASDPVQSLDPEAAKSKGKRALSKEQLASLMRGASKTNRFVLYVTNLSFETTKEVLQDHFGAVGAVKSVRIPKKRRGGFAFVEMSDVDGYQRAFELHDSELQGRRIKIQFSEAGKKKSANKRNIIKQKNRKLAQMRKEQKCFTKSGKFYDKNLKKEKALEAVARKRWRKKPAAKPSAGSRT